MNLRIREEKECFQDKNEKVSIKDHADIVRGTCGILILETTYHERKSLYKDLTLIKSPNQAAHVLESNIQILRRAGSDCKEAIEDNLLDPTCAMTSVEELKNILTHAATDNNYFSNNVIFVIEALTIIGCIGRIFINACSFNSMVYHNQYFHDSIADIHIS